MLNKKLLDEIKNISLISLVAIIILKIVFYKEDFFVIIQFYIGVFWTFILPGYLIMNFWQDKIGIVERFIAGFPISAAIVGIGSYYLGIIGVHTRLHHIFLPILTIVIVFIIKRFLKDRNKKDNLVI